MDVGYGDLPVEVIEALRAEGQELIRIDFHAAVGGGVGLVGDLLAEVWLFDSVVVEQEGADG